jgi:hypothetical protein
MDRAEILAQLAKATITTTVGAGGLLDPAQSRSFLEVAQESSDFGRAIRKEFVGVKDGEINKLNTGQRVIRAAAENADDGYRVEATFPTVPYSTVKIRLPFEITEDELEQNIDKRQLEEKLVRRFGNQLGLDLDDLNTNGDTAAGAGPDQAFLQIDDGLEKLAATAAGVHRIDGSTINAGVLSKAHLFAGTRAMPNKYRANPGVRWIMSPNRHIQWIETLTDRATAAGDAALGGASGPGNSPLGIPVLENPYLDDTRILLTNPNNLVRVMFNQVKRYRVTPNTDWELATRDKNGYIFFVRQDFIIEETDALVDIHTLDAIP